MSNLAQGATVTVAAAGGYAALYRLGQTWGPPPKSSGNRWPATSSCRRPQR